MTNIDIRDERMAALSDEVRSRGFENVQAYLESLIERHLRELARGKYARDGLTGCSTRYEFERLLREVTWGTSWTDRSLYEERYLCIDVDCFKSYLDVRGLEAGDLVLRSLSRGLVDSYGDSSVYRWGGDDFVVTLGSRRVSLPAVADGLVLKHSIVEVAVPRNQRRNHHVNAWIRHHLDAGVLTARPEGHYIRCGTPIGMRERE